MSLTRTDDRGARDDDIALDSHTTVLRRPGVPYDLFATCWRDVHRPLCSRLPGLRWYVQYHFERDRTAHAWPRIDGIAPFEDCPLDGFAEIGFLTADDPQTFFDASPILFSDEQTMFAATVDHDLPQGSTTLVDRITDPAPPAPHVDHEVPSERRSLAILEPAFETPLARRTVPNMRPTPENSS